MKKHAERRAAFAFGIVFVCVLLVLALLIPNPTPFQYMVFRIVLALAAAGVAAMIPGFLQLTVPGWIRAGGALAVFAIVYFYNPAQLVTEQPQARLVTLVDSNTRREVLGDLNSLLEGSIAGITVDLDPISSAIPWFALCKTLADKSPSLVIAHLHALRDIDERDDYVAEEDLLLGLSRIMMTSPNVRFVIYSRLFSTADSDTHMAVLGEAASRIAQKSPATRADIELLMKRVTTVYWGEYPSDLERQTMFRVVKTLTESGPAG